MMDIVSFIKDNDQYEDFFLGELSDKQEISLLKEGFKNKNKLSKKQKIKLLRMFIAYSTKSLHDIKVLPCKNNIYKIKDKKSKEFFKMFHEIYSETKLKKNEYIDVGAILELEEVSKYKDTEECYSCRVTESDIKEPLKDFETFMDAISDGYEYLDGFYSGFENFSLVMPFMHNIYLNLKKKSL